MEAAQVVVRRVVIAVAAVAALLTSACAAGQYAQSATERETTDGTSVKVGAMTLGGLAVERPPNGISYDRGADVGVNLVLVNSGARSETLTSITSPAITGWGAFGNASDASAYAAAQAAAGSSSSSPSPSDSASSSAGATPSASSSASTASGPRPRTSVSIASQSRVQFGSDSVAGAPPNRVLVLFGIKRALHPGMSIPMTFTFSRAGTVTVQVPVQLSDTPHTSVVPGPSATGEEG